MRADKLLRLRSPRLATVLRARHYGEPLDPFEVPDDIFKKHHGLYKSAVGWLCDEVRNDVELQKQRCLTRTVLTVTGQVLIALRFYAIGGFQQAVASYGQLAVSQQAVSDCIRKVTGVIVRHLVDFPRTKIAKAAVKEGCLRMMKISGVVGSTDCFMSRLL